MALHELATNAAKHGALLYETGGLDVRWRLTHDRNHIQLEWEESGGSAIDIDLEIDLGLGIPLVQGLICHELGGEAEYEATRSGGLWKLQIPTKYSGP